MSEILKKIDELENLIEFEFNKVNECSDSKETKITQLCEQIIMLKCINNENHNNLKNMDKTLFEFLNKNNILRQENNILKKENKIIKIICYSCVLLFSYISINSVLISIL